MIDQYLKRQVEKNTEDIAKKASSAVPIFGGRTTGDSSNYILTIPEAGNELVENLLLLVDLHVTNATAPTLNFNGTGAKPIKLGTELLAGGKLPPNKYLFQYTGVTWDIISGGGSGNYNIFGTTTGADNVYSVNIDEAPELKTGLELTLVIHMANTAQATLNYNNNGARFIMYNDLPLTGGILQPNMVIKVVYDGSDWEIVGGIGGSGGGGSGDYVINKGITSGTGLAYTIEIPGFSPVEGAIMIAEIHATNEADATMNLNGTTELPIKYSGERVLSETLIAGSFVQLMYHESSWELIAAEGRIINTIIGKITKIYNFNPPNNASTLSYIGGTIDEYDDTRDTFRFLINGIEKIPTVDYTVNTADETVSLLGFTANSADDYTFIVYSYQEVSGVPTNIIEQLTQYDIKINSVTTTLEEYDEKINTAVESINKLAEDIALLVTDINTSAEVNLRSTDWIADGANYTMTVAVEGITATNIVLFGRSVNNNATAYEEFATYAIEAIEQREGFLRIRSNEGKPSLDVLAMVVILN